MRKPRRRKISTLHLEFVLRWRRFSYERTPKRERRWLYDRQLNFISCSVPAPCSLGQVVTMISEQAKDPIRIDVLSPELQTPVLSRSMAVFGYAWDEIDKIARNYPNMVWWISEHGLRMETVLPTPPRRDFDQIAGRLLFEARKECLEQTRLSPDQYLNITAQLEDFKPLDLLPKAHRTELAEWNKKNGKRAIHTLSEAIKAKQPRGLHRQIMKLFYRAHDKFIRQQ